MPESEDSLRGLEIEDSAVTPVRRVSDELQALDPENSLSRMQLEIAGMFVAMGLIDRKARDPLKPGLTPEDIFAVNKAVVNDPLNPHLYGVLRRVPIREVVCTVRGERRVSVIDYPKPDELQAQFDKYAQDLTAVTERINGETPIAEVIDAAAMAHDEFVRIHPFRDGNGRTAREIVDFIFKRSGLSYITDWGAENDEYKDVVDRRFREDSPDLFKGFLASKLVKRAGELNKKGLISNGTLNQVQSDAGQYVQGLSLNAA